MVRRNYKIIEERFMNLHDEEYITLFCEGDGHVRIDPHGLPKIVFAQKERDVLDYINSLFSGGHYYQSKAAVWQLTFIGRSCMPLLEIFAKHVVGKKFLERLNRVLIFVDMPLTIQHPLTLDGFVGFWDAEGSSDSSPKISLYQKDREILDLVTSLVGGNVYPQRDVAYQWNLCNKKASLLFSEILSKSHCPSKIERLHKNFNGPSYHKLHRCDSSHKNTKKMYDKVRQTNQTLIREYMKLHPEVVEALKLKNGIV